MLLLSAVTPLHLLAEPYVECYGGSVNLPDVCCTCSLRHGAIPRTQLGAASCRVAPVHLCITAVCQALSRMEDTPPLRPALPCDLCMICRQVGPRPAARGQHGTAALQGEQWVQEQDGRDICLQCLNSMVTDTQDCQPLYNQVCAAPAHAWCKPSSCCCCCGLLPGSAHC